MKTYTRLEAAATFGVSNTIVARNLKAVIEYGFDKSALVTDENRLTERAIYLIGLYREKDFSMLDDELEAERLASDPLQSDVCDSPAEDEIFGTYPAAPAGSITLADRCGEIAANVGTVEVMSSEPYEQRASNARASLANFVAARNARSQKLARNAATARRSIEQIAAEHAIGDLLTYSDTYDRLLAEGLQATQGAAVAGLDSMGKPAAEAG